MGHNPAFQFYPADWLNDIKLQSCSLEAQGLLINLMCLMHQSKKYGYLLINDHNPSNKEVSHLLRLHHKTYQARLIELLLYGVLRKDNNDIIYCERMVKDEYIREVRREAGKLGGSPLLKQKVKQVSKQKPTPSSSSSSSSSSKIIKDIYSRVIEYLNLQTGKNFRVNNKKTQALIKARLNEEFTEQDFINVIDNKMNWLSDPKMVEFLRPETLFGTKFESYLQDNKKEDLMDKWVRDKEKEEGDG